MSSRFPLKSSLSSDAHLNFRGCDPTPDVRGVAPDDVYSSLDGCQVTLGGKRWTVAVFGVHDSHDARWVQVGLDGEESRAVLLKLKPGEGAFAAIVALTTSFSGKTSARVYNFV